MSGNRRANTPAGLPHALVLFALLGASLAAATETIAVNDDGGVCSVPVQINGVLSIDFVIDTGASTVMIPADVALTLKRAGTLSAADQLGTKEYELADGSVVEHRRVVLRTLQIGSRTLHNVEGVIGGLESTLLLGQNALRQLEPWRLDTRGGRLIVMQADVRDAVEPALGALPTPAGQRARPARMAATRDRDLGQPAAAGCPAPARP